MVNSNGEPKMSLRDVNYLFVHVHELHLSSQERGGGNMMLQIGIHKYINETNKSFFSSKKHGLCIYSVSVSWSKQILHCWSAQVHL